MSRILLVDDDADFRGMLHTMLEGAGHEVREATGGKIALELDREDPSDLIIMDLVMPEKDGLETIQELRRVRPDAKIIAISGGVRMSPNTNLKVARWFGAAHTLGKPFSRTEILQLIDAVLATPSSVDPE